MSVEFLCLWIIDYLLRSSLLVLGLRYSFCLSPCFQQLYVSDDVCMHVMHVYRTSRLLHHLAINVSRVKPY